MTRPAVRFAVRLTPRGGVDRIDGVIEGVLRARVAAPAVDGAANVALIRLLAGEFDVAPSDVRLVSGATARRKLIAIEGGEPAVLLARWPDLAV